MSERISEQERDEAIEHLREVFPPGSTARTILRHVSSSGMTRWISVIGTVDGETMDVSWWVGRAIGERANRGQHEGIKVGGCGMDMGFALIYQMSSTLYPEGFECIGKDCPSNDHSNGDRDYSPHHHGSGGYAVSQRWL